MNRIRTLWRSRTALLSVVLCGLATAPRSQAAVVAYDIDALVNRSEFIVCGRVVAIESYWGSIGELGPVILTDVTLEVSEAWKGNPEGGRITLQLLGGRIGDRWQYCAESPRFASGEEVLVFARKYAGRLWATGWAQGKYRIVADRDRGTREVVGRKSGPIEGRTALESLRGRVVEILERARAEAENAAEKSAAGASGTADPRGTERADGEVKR